LVAVGSALAYMAHALMESPTLASTFCDRGQNPSLFRPETTGLFASTHRSFWPAFDACLMAGYWRRPRLASGRYQSREETMNKLVVPAVVVAANMLLASAAWAQAPALQNHRYFTTPLENDPTREVGMQSVTMPPGAGNQFHRHPGDQWTAVQEGEVTFTVKGQPPRILKAGDSNYVPRGTIHRQQNLSDKPARYIEMRIFDKGRPAAEQVTE
jgi:quercetin dioxygenase-like cupin family protein